jgi:nicotinamidase-related amidase
MTTALLIIDVQTAICSGEWEAFESRRVIERINHVSQLARQAKVPVIVIQHEEAGGPMMFENEGWQLDPDLKVQQGDSYIRKATPDSFHNTGLLVLLQTLGVKKLVICGRKPSFAWTPPRGAPWPWAFPSPWWPMDIRPCTTVC